MQLRRWMVVSILLLLAVPGRARDLYVDNVAGDDRFDGLIAEANSELSGPFRTITSALLATRKGDRIILANTGEPYRESITLQGGRQSGFTGQPFELIGNGAVLDGTVAVPTEAWRYYSGNIFRFRPPRTSFQLLYLDAKPAQQTKVTERAEIAQLEPQHWCLFEQHVYYCVEPGRLPQTYALSYTGLSVGITLYEVRNVAVRDLVVQGFQLDGVNAHDGVLNATLSGLVCRGNGRSGVSIGGASRVRIEACLVGNNGVAQVRTEGRCRAHLVGCDLLDNTAPKIERDGGQVVIDP